MREAATLQHALYRFVDPSGLDGQRQRVCSHLLGCRTAAMGGWLLQCSDCDYSQTHYFGCRDRHCPQCQGRAMRQWAERRHHDILPVTYYHVVFTLPHELNGWVQLHPEVIHRLLFHSAWGTLDAFGRDPKRLNGQMGMTAVLHTWGQNLSQHVHLHCLVPGGALGDDGRWRSARSNYLFPVRALSRHFRGRMVSALRTAADAGALHRVTRTGEVAALLKQLMAHEWVVYTKNCLHHTATVVDYLARYTRRIAISNARIQAVDDHGVTLRYKDYRHGGRNRTMTLDGAEFVRRFLLHVLPKGLMRVRHYGFLANRCRRRRLAQIRQALAVAEPEANSDDIHQDPAVVPCPHCRDTVLQVRAVIPPRMRPTRPPNQRRRMRFRS